MSRYIWSTKGMLGVVAVLAVLLLVAWVGPASAADAEAGKVTFKKRCVVCHGNSGAGDGVMGKMLKPPPPSFADASRMAGQSDEALTKIITSGKDKMPAYEGKLSASEIQDVLAYIRTLAAK